MPPADRHQQDISALRDRLTRLSQARLNINESLDRDHVFRKALSSARSLTRVSVPSSSRVGCQAFCQISQGLFKVPQPPLQVSLSNHRGPSFDRLRTSG